MALHQQDIHYCSYKDSATPAVYPLSLHDALPILSSSIDNTGASDVTAGLSAWLNSLPSNSHAVFADRKSTRLNSSHPSISYAVFCLKKKIARFLASCCSSLKWKLFRLYSTASCTS